MLKVNFICCLKKINQLPQGGYGGSIFQKHVFAGWRPGQKKQFLKMVGGVLFLLLPDSRVRADRPSVRGHQNGPELVTRNRVFAMVTPSSVTKFGLVCVHFRLLENQYNKTLVSVSGLWNNAKEYTQWVRPPKYTSELHQNGYLSSWAYLLMENAIGIYLQVPFGKNRCIFVKNIRSKHMDRIFLTLFSAVVLY